MWERGREGVRMNKKDETHTHTCICIYHLNLFQSNIYKSEQVVFEDEQELVPIRQEVGQVFGVVS